MKRSLTCLLALVLILAGVANADTTAAGPCLTSIATYNASDTIALALLALTVSFDVIAIAYIINKLFPSTGVRDWINTEYWEVAKTALLIVSIYAVLSVLGNVASLVAPQQLVNPIGSGPDFSASSVSGLYGLVNGACTYLNGETTFEGTTLNYLFGLGWSVGLIKNTQVTAVTKIPVSVTPPIELDSGFLMNIYFNNMIATEPGQSPYQSMLNDLLMIVAVPVTLITQVQLELLPILFTLGLGVLIPLGLLLRAFPFIRGIGGTFVAIGIGLSLIYPASLVLLELPRHGRTAGDRDTSHAEQLPGRMDYLQPSRDSVRVTRPRRFQPRPARLRGRHGGNGEPIPCAERHALLQLVPAAAVLPVHTRPGYRFPAG